MSIRGTVIFGIFAILGLFLLASFWLVRLGMERYKQDTLAQLHIELLEQGAADFEATARGLFHVYEALPADQRASDPVAALQPFLPEEPAGSILFFNPEGGRLDGAPLAHAIEQLAAPELLQAFYNEAARDDKHNMTVDNYAACLAGEADTPAILHLRAYPGENLILGKGQTQELAGIRLQSISDMAASATQRLTRQGAACAFILLLATLGLAWTILQYGFFRPLARTFAKAGQQHPGTGISWSQLKEYAGRLQKLSAEMDAARAKLEHEIGTRFQAEEDRDRIKSQMDHALHKYEEEIQREYGQHLQASQAALMRREARALHRHLASPLESAREALAGHPENEPARTAVDRCVATVRALVDETVDLPHSPQRVSLQPWLEELVSRFQDDHAVTVRTNIANNARVNIDPGSLRQAVEFVLENALQASGESGPIEVDASTTDEHVEIRIVDRGPGIDAEARPHILVPFYTLDEEGNGLGLAVTHSVIRQHGGRLRFQSEAGKGTAVVIVLPAARD